MEANSNETQKKSNAERQACYRVDKLFKTLPLDVQHSIESLSDTPEEKAQRTAIALDYQKRFTKRPGTGIDCRMPKNLARPGDEDYQASGVTQNCECGSLLPQLEQPRQYKGTCQPCVSAR